MLTIFRNGNEPIVPQNTSVQLFSAGGMNQGFHWTAGSEAFSHIIEGVPTKVQTSTCKPHTRGRICFRPTSCKEQYILEHSWLLSGWFVHCVNIVNIVNKICLHCPHQSELKRAEREVHTRSYVERWGEYYIGYIVLKCIQLYRDPSSDCVLLLFSWCKSNNEKQ